MTKEEKRKAENERDSKLIENYLAGDVSAFGKLTELHRETLTRYNFSVLHNMEDAKDATQEEFVIVMKVMNEGKYEERKRFGGWMKRMAKYYLTHVQRKKALKTVEVEVVGDVKDEPMEGERRSEEEIKKLKKAMKGLPERDVQLIWLRYWKKLAWKEIGVLLKITENGASGRHKKVLNKLRGRVEWSV